MEKYKTIILIEKIRKCLEEGNTQEALKIAESIDQKKLKNMSDLSVVAECYFQNCEYHKAKVLFSRIYEKNKSRRIVSQLVHLSIKLNDVIDAKQYLAEFIQIAPEDFYQYIFRYSIDKLTKAPLAKLIEDLVELKHAEYIESWAYELAKLYHKSGMKEECIAECDEIVLWFGSGEYVERAKALRAYYRGEIKIHDTASEEDSQTTSVQDTERLVNGSKEGNEESREDIAGKLEENFEQHRSETVTENNEQTIEENEEYNIEEPVKQEIEETVKHEIEEPVKQEINETVKQEIEETVKQEIEGTVKHEIEENVAEDHNKNSHEIMRGSVKEDNEESLKGSIKDVKEENIEENIEENFHDSNQEELNKVSSDSFVESSHNPEVMVEDGTLDFQTLESALAKQLEWSFRDDDKEVGATMEAKQIADEEELAEESIETSEPSSKFQAKVNLSILTNEQILSEEEEELVKNLAQNQVSLSDIFGNFMRMDEMRRQIVCSMDQVLTQKAKFIIITGELGSGKTYLAKRVAKLLYRMKQVSSSKVALVEGEKLTSKNLMTKKEQLKGCVVVIEHASKMSKETVKTLLELCSMYHNNIAIILEDTRDQMNQLLQSNTKLTSVFNNRVHLPKYSLDDYMGFAFDYITEHDYEIEMDAYHELQKNIAEFIQNKRENAFQAIFSYLDIIILKSEKRSTEHLKELSQTGRYSETELMVLKTQDMK